VTANPPPCHVTRAWLRRRAREHRDRAARRVAQEQAWLTEQEEMSSGRTERRQVERGEALPEREP